MFLIRWIQGRCHERQLIELAEPPSESSGRLYVDNQEHPLIEEADHTPTSGKGLQPEEHDAILYGLQQTMDPVIAAQVYNDRHCALLSRLPEELLLSIVEFLRDDDAAIHCLRIVSRKFLRLLNPQSVFWGRRAYLRRNGGDAFYLHDNLRLEFRKLLQRDGRCSNCRHWNNTHPDIISDDCKFQQRFRLDTSWCDQMQYCSACNCLHDSQQFSSYNQKPDSNLRVCLGHEGAVYLCEHVQITWSSIKAHISTWQQSQQARTGDWQAWLRSFKVECQDPSHDTRCTPAEAPTWPRARLCTSNLKPDIIVLNLEWEPHIRIDAITLTANGKIPASELRGVFKKFREVGPVDTLCPSHRPDHFPELACSSSQTPLGAVIHFETGECDITAQKLPPLPGISWQLDQRHGRGHNGKNLTIQPHYLKNAVSTGLPSQCLIVSYEKDVMICQTRALVIPSTKLVPTDHWLHAMDTRSYPHPQASHIRPQCRDEGCVNYYRRRRDYYTCSPSFRV
ncbi:hypothetical protein DM02DRAFT_668502 [Periconia macrospinosa]|uniref:F-box domain-containing protein n=1 Tax=Periconia macrospinosa TaxID=97972 RepID=A0A2V1E7L6_9PLEO|nr:hypothetical protein DM02DRAFT_668502 [Periconia macrospinosa]